MSEHALFQDVIRKRRSVRKFEPGRHIGRDVLQRIVDCGRWAPSGANVQCWDFIVVDDATGRDKVMAVFLHQAQRLVDHAKGFPAVKKSYSINSWPDRDEMLGRWKDAFTGNVTNPAGMLEQESDFSKPRVIGQATKRRKISDTKDA